MGRRGELPQDLGGAGGAATGAKSGASGKSVRRMGKPGLGPSTEEPGGSQRTGTVGEARGSEVAKGRLVGGVAQARAAIWSQLALTNSWHDFCCEVK
jgi:hypothetical protein